jgi:phosphoglycerate dehydrogenase-like enzyme
MTRVTIAPGMSAGIVAALREVDGIDLVEPEDTAGVVAADAPVLVTFRWEPAYLTPGLCWVQAISAGTEHLPAAELDAAGVVLTSARGIHGHQVAEHAFALLLAMTRGIAPAVRAQAEREWRWQEVAELSGMTMGVLGLGIIGEAVAERAAAFGMRVIGTKRDRSGYAGAATEVLGPDGTLEVCRRADVLVVVLPGGEATRHVVGAAELAALGEGWLVSVGRGSVVDENALVAALTEGGLRGAGLDVYETEPLPEGSPLWGLPNVVISPHCAGATPHYGARLAEVFAANLAAFRGAGEWATRVLESR